MRGKRHEIDYGSVKEFERSFEKVVCEGGLVFPLAVKIVILEKLVKKKKEFSKLLEKCIE